MVFDDSSKLTMNQKTFKIYQYILYYLAKFSLNTWSEDDNPMIRLKDDLSVSENDILDVIQLKVK